MIKEVTLDFKTEGRKRGVVGIFLEQVVNENVGIFLTEQNIIPLMKVTKEKFIIPRPFRIGIANFTLDNNPDYKFEVDIRIGTLSITFIFTKHIDDYSKQDILKLKIPDMYKFEFDVKEFLESFKEKFIDDR